MAIQQTTLKEIANKVHELVRNYPNYKNIFQKHIETYHKKNDGYYKYLTSFSPEKYVLWYFGLNLSDVFDTNKPIEPSNQDERLMCEYAGLAIIHDTQIGCLLPGCDRLFKDEINISGLIEECPLATIEKNNKPVSKILCVVENIKLAFENVKADLDAHKKIDGKSTDNVRTLTTLEKLHYRLIREAQERTKIQRLERISEEQTKSKIILNTAKRVEELVSDSATMQRWREKMALTFKRPEVSNVKNYDAWQKWLFNLNPSTHLDVLYTLLAFCHDDYLHINPIITDTLKKQAPSFCESTNMCIYLTRDIPNKLDVFLSYLEKDLASGTAAQEKTAGQNGGEVGKMEDKGLIIKALKNWREAADKFGIDSSQAMEKGAIAMPLLFENREQLPESNQRFQLRGLEDRFTIDEIKTMNDGGNCGFYADKNFIADLEKLSASGDEAGKTKQKKARKKTPPQFLKETRERQAAKELADNPEITAEELGKILDCNKSTVVRLKAWQNKGVLANPPLPNGFKKQDNDGKTDVEAISENEPDEDIENS